VVTLRLVGRLGGPEARELARARNAVGLTPPHQTVLFDLTGLTGVDIVGKEFLAQAHRSGDTLVGGRHPGQSSTRSSPDRESRTVPTVKQERFVTVFLEECTPSSVLEVEGTLRAPIDMTLRQKVEALLSCGQRRIVLNLARLSDIDAAGIGELMRAYHLTSAVGGVLQIAHADRRVRQLLEVAGVLSVLSPPARDTRGS
jgi:anti-anti-sigma factor